VVPFPPGGSVDVVARLVAPGFQAAFAQPVVIENRPGAVGTIGTNTVAKAAPDGHTLVMTIGAHTIVPAVMASLPYNTATDLAGISLIASAPNMLVARTEFPARTLADLVAMARKEPGKLSYSTAGVGSTSHVMGSMLERAAGISLHHVPYQGGAASLQAVLGGQTDLNSAVSTTALPMVRAGRLRAFAIVGERRSRLFPDVPTFGELGFSPVKGDSWIGLLAPAATPRPTISRLYAELKRTLESSGVREKLEEQALEVIVSPPEDFDQQIRSELALYADFAKATGLKLP
jgi:tripartite-type tricarboxylate transporter receptor subunit TctC